MALEIRRTFLHVEKILIDGGRPAAKPTTLIAALAIVRNPWFGKGFVEDLRPGIKESSPVLGALLTSMIVETAGSSAAVEAFGKAAVAGMGGDVEHASAMIHTLRFGNHYRTAVEAKSYLSFTNTRGPANTSIMIPLMDKNDSGRRSHYLTITLSIPDAPADDEIAVALGGSIGGRPHHRIGDRYQDLKELGAGEINPAGN